MSQLKVDSIIPRGGLAAGAFGGVIQTVFAHKTGMSSINPGRNGTATIPNMSCAITMASSSNKVFIHYSIVYDTGTSNGKGGFRIYRGSTNVGQPDSASNRYLVHTGYGANANQDQSMMNTSGTFIDTPGSGTHTYTIRAYNCDQSDATFAVRINGARQDSDETDDGRACSSLLVQEIAV
ncbi:MAG: hypothetical protein CMA53_01635 [Euryarchaeota archaeon]|nr:hypothetical protein [Euryarchaeota archaeon]|tara:strand:- start:574 stop:1113 length:540 start_codon:yes stop_codon:yes gene_type:complete